MKIFATILVIILNLNLSAQTNEEIIQQIKRDYQLLTQQIPLGDEILIDGGFGSEIIDVDGSVIGTMISERHKLIKDTRNNYNIKASKSWKRNLQDSHTIQLFFEPTNDSLVDTARKILAIVSRKSIEMGMGAEIQKDKYYFFKNNQLFFSHEIINRYFSDGDGFARPDDTYLSARENRFYYHQGSLVKHLLKSSSFSFESFDKDLHLYDEEERYSIWEDWENYFLRRKSAIAAWHSKSPSREGNMDNSKNMKDLQSIIDLVRETIQMDLQKRLEF